MSSSKSSIATNLSLLGLGLGLGVAGGFLIYNPVTNLIQSKDLVSPFVKQEATKDTSLSAYSIPNLINRQYQVSGPIQLLELKQTDPDFQSFVFNFTTLGKNMSGLINVPTSPAPKNGFPVLLMIRGYAPLENYTSGVGTKNASFYFAKKGFVTLAPDFFGYGSSAPDPIDSLEARFIKPISVIELLKTIETYPSFKIEAEKFPKSVTTGEIKLNPQKLGFWAHSNGGQITLSVLEVLGKDYPTTLWAPVTAPFPYSVLFFTDENDDEGKEARTWIASFEEDYDAFDYSLTKHLDKLHGEIQLHQGTADEAAMKAWQDEFLLKVKKANASRDKNDQIKFNYFVYPGADHNLKPGWDTAISRDWEYFQKKLEL